MGQREALEAVVRRLECRVVSPSNYPYGNYDATHLLRRVWLCGGDEIPGVATNLLYRYVTALTCFVVRNHIYNKHVIPNPEDVWMSPYGVPDNLYATDKKCYRFWVREWHKLRDGPRQKRFGHVGVH
jgi:hypothetical protein